MKFQNIFKKKAKKMCREHKNKFSYLENMYGVGTFKTEKDEWQVQTCF